MENKPVQIKISDGVKSLDPSEFKLLGKSLDYWIEINSLIESNGVDGLAAEIVNVRRELKFQQELLSQLLRVIKGAVVKIEEVLNGL